MLATMRALYPALAIQAPATPRLRLRGSDGAVRMLAIATILAIPVIALSLANAGGLRIAWGNLHLSGTALVAAIATAWSVRGTEGRVRTVRFAGAIAFALWLAGTLVWTGLYAIGRATIPSVADIFIFAILVPGTILLAATIRGRVTIAEEAAVYLDSALGFLLIATILIVLDGAVVFALPTASGIVALAYPTAFIGLGVAGLIGIFAARYAIAAVGALPLVIGSIAIGIAYLGWIAPTVNGVEAGALPSVLFTVGTLLAAYGLATWQDSVAEDRRVLAAMGYLAQLIGPIVAGVLFLALLVPVSASIDGAIRVAVFAGGGLFVTRQALLLRERTRNLAAVRRLTAENGRLVEELRQELEHRAIDQRRIIQASRAAAVGDLAAGVAHEVNNPLTGVLGFAELLIEATNADDPRRADLETIRDEAIRAREIVRAMRDFANPPAPQLGLTDLSDLAHDTVDLVRYSIERRGTTIVEDLPTLPPILIDRPAMQQALLNILTNARQATSAGGRIEISSRIEADDRVVAITDDGIGMDDATVRLAFDPFFTGRDEDLGLEPGAGLGLSVSNGLIESHGGTITISSRPGRGTTVEIRLPDARSAVNPEGGRGTVA